MNERFIPCNDPVNWILRSADFIIYIFCYKKYMRSYSYYFETVKASLSLLTRWSAKSFLQAITSLELLAEKIEAGERKKKKDPSIKNLRKFKWTILKHLPWIHDIRDWNYFRYRAAIRSHSMSEREWNRVDGHVTGSREINKQRCLLHLCDFAAKRSAGARGRRTGQKGSSRWA